MADAGTLSVAEHPLLRIGALASAFRSTLGEIGPLPWLADLLRADAPAPLERSEEVRRAVRDMLRCRGYKPTGRGKPSSEYLLRAAGEGELSPINAAVDACNAVSLHSGLPISVVDADLARPPLRIDVPGPGSGYVFNASGQTIDVEGIPCLFDAEGPCANAVKDAQRTKTHAGTRRTLSVVWGCAGQEALVEKALAWYREVLERAGASVARVAAG